MSRPDATAAARPYPPILTAVVIAILLLLAIAGFGSYRDLQSARQRQLLLEDKIEATRARNAALAERIRRLQEDPAAIERLAREQYHMMRPGDVVIVLPTEVAAAATPAAVSPSPDRPLPE